MLNNNLTFGYSEDGLITKKIPSADANVAIEDTFCIEWMGTGFWIYPYGSSRVINHANVTGTHNVDLETISKDYATNNASWNLIRYTGEERHGATLNYTEEALYAGMIITMTPIVWATDIGYNTPEIIDITGYTDKATVSYWSNQEQKGGISLHDDGVAKLKCRIYNGSRTSYYEITFDLQVSLVVEEGVYYIENKEFGKYMQIDDNEEPDYDDVGAFMELWDFSGHKYQRWQLVHIINGYYKIISVQSGLALCIEKDAHVNTNDHALVQKPYEDIDRMKWKITRSDTGAYVVRPKSGESGSEDWCMCAGDQLGDISDGLNVEQQAYRNNNSYKDEWFIQSINCSTTTPLIAQKGNMWCWAACAQMLASTKHPTAANTGDSTAIEHEQQNIVYHMFGDGAGAANDYDWINDPQDLKNHGGIYTDVAEAAAYLVGQVGGDETFAGYATPYGESKLLHFLLDGHAVARLYGWAFFSSNSLSTLEDYLSVLTTLIPETGGHVTVIVGARWSEERQCYMYTIHDPEITYPLEYSYTELLYNGIRTENGFMVSVWFPTVVTKTGYSDQTFIKNRFGVEYSSD